MNTKPHVIIIMADHLRVDSIGPWTPNIQALESDSVVFEQAYCASPLCVPARGSFFTGKYPNVTGSINNAKIRQESESGYVRSTHETLYELMEDSWDSWHTGKHNLYTEKKIEKNPASKTHWLQMEGRYEQFLREHGKRPPGGPRFRTLIPETVGGTTTRRAPCTTQAVGCYEEGIDYFVDGFITQDTMTALRERDRDKPLLLNAMYFAPHPPFDIPDPWFNRVKDIPMPDNVGVWGKGQSPLQLYNLPGILGGRYHREDWQEVWDVFMGYVSLFDDCVGSIIAELKHQGIYDDSLIILTSDHGEMLGSHCLFQKMCMYEEAVRTPLSIKFPKNEYAGSHITETVSAVDVLPTLCVFLDLVKPADLCGQSLIPLVHGETLNREAVFIQYDGNGSRSSFQRCVISGQYKLIVDMFKDEVFLELYRLDEDAQEMNNLAFESRERNTIERLLLLLRKHMVETEDALAIPFDIVDKCSNQYSPYL